MLWFIPDVSLRSEKSLTEKRLQRDNRLSSIYSLSLFVLSMSPSLTSYYFTIFRLQPWTIVNSTYIFFNFEFAWIETYPSRTVIRNATMLVLFAVSTASLWNAPVLSLSLWPTLLAHLPHMRIREKISGQYVRSKEHKQKLPAYTENLTSRNDYHCSWNLCC